MIPDTIIDRGKLHNLCTARRPWKEGDGTFVHLDTVQGEDGKVRCVHCGLVMDHNGPTPGSCLKPQKGFMDE